MRRTTRSQTAAQRQPEQPAAMQPAISEDQRAHALNNVLEVENVAQKEEVPAEVAAPIQIAAISNLQEAEEEKKERRSQLSQSSKAISKGNNCTRYNKYFSRKDNLQRHMRKVNCNASKGSQREGGAASEAISINDNTFSAVNLNFLS